MHNPVTYFYFNRKQKPFSDGELAKEIIFQSMETLLANHRDKDMILNKINLIQLSRQTVARRLDLMANKLISKLKNILKNAKAISICLDESTDIKDMGQLIIWVRVVTKNLKVTEEILDCIKLTDTTTSADIYNELHKCLEGFKLTFNNIVAITTDGAPSMVGIKNGLIAKVKKENAKLIGMHCIIHQ